MSKVKAKANKAGSVEAPRSVNLDKLNLTELKAMAYDILAMIEKCQADLRQVNDLIRAKQRKGFNDKKQQCSK